MNLLKKLFGTKYDKDVKRMKPIVVKINEYYEEFESLSEDELKNKTNEFKERIFSAVKSLEDERDQLQTDLMTENLIASEIAEHAEKIKKIETKIHDETQEVLNDILPEAYAVVKQTCKRLTEQKFTYDYANQSYTWDMIPYDVQLIGGITLHEGNISEMATGEGKTLVAVAPVYLNALPGKGVHLVTVNDYLAKRDCDWMSPVYNYLGLSADALQGNMDNDARKKIYDLDITYGTNNEFGFDYLRDNMVIELEHKVQRKEHWFAMVDEVDSVLIDEARTPLIISGPVPQADQKFEELNPKVRSIVQAQNQFVNQEVADAIKLLDTAKEQDDKKGKETKKDAGVKLFRAQKGLPKHKRLTKVLQNPDLKKLVKDTELIYLAEKGKHMHIIDDDLYYVVEEKNNSIDLTDKGAEYITSGQDDPDMFILPDITASLSELEGNSEIAGMDKQVKKDEIYRIFSERSDRLHTLQQLLKAYTLFEKDVEYVIQDKKIMIVDENTGRIMDGRRYSDGLHQAIEAKESVKVERDTQTMATITLQNYFRLYHKLSGMTGTAETEAAEFDNIYKLDTVVIPTNRIIVRDDQEDLIFKTTREKFNAVIEQSIELLDAGRAVLVGTASVEVSEVLSKMFTRKKVKHNVLNAKNHLNEADIIANAGKSGTLTIATNMAGRGTDIKLSPEVKAAGGLAIIGSERHDARRIDRQLRGRSGRQGDPGSSIFFISLEDKLMRLFGGERVAGIMSKLKIPEGEPIQHSMISKSVEKAQKKVEENSFGTRKRLIDYDDVMNHQRNVIYTRRNAALRGERLKGELFEYIEDMVHEWYDEFIQLEDNEGFIHAVRTKLLCDIKLTQEEFLNTEEDNLAIMVLKEAEKFYTQKEEMTGIDFMKKLERVAVLQTIDDKWKDHLRAMDEMKEGIHLRSYGQKDPLLEYKKEAFELFFELIKDINQEAVSFAFRYFPKMVQHNEGGSKSVTIAPVDPKMRNATLSNANLNFQHSTTAPAYTQSGGGGVPQMQGPEGDQASTVSKTIKRKSRKIGRNEVVTVEYPDGRRKEIKYKKVEFEVEEGLCKVVE